MRRGGHAHRGPRGVSHCRAVLPRGLLEGPRRCHRPRAPEPQGPWRDATGWRVALLDGAGIVQWHLGHQARARGAARQQGPAAGWMPAEPGRRGVVAAAGRLARATRAGLLTTGVSGTQRFPRCAREPAHRPRARWPIGAGARRGRSDEATAVRGARERRARRAPTPAAPLRRRGPNTCAGWGGSHGPSRAHPLSSGPSRGKRLLCR